ncbi:MAG TPA: hypothetical protein VMF66_16650 [Candidatus Acidoferrum sp.]|nr:hypothetical protein [Candidatus Acidoferrum sp.]
MKTNLIASTLAVAAGAAMGSIYGGSALGPKLGSTWDAVLWIAYNAPALMARIAWQDFSCVLEGSDACALVGTILLLMVVAGVARR